MSCVYTYEGKEYSEDQFKGVLTSMDLQTASNYAPVKPVNLPFVQDTSWQNLVMKRIMRMAAEGGYDRVAFINGEQTADRYSLDKKINEIEIMDNEDGRQVIVFMPGNEVVVSIDNNGTIKESETEPSWIGKDLSDLIGKDIATKIMKAKPGDKLSGKDLKIEAKWARELYDVAIPNWLKGFGKNKDARVENFDPGTGKKQTSIPITDKMRDAVMGGQARFSIKDQGAQPLTGQQTIDAGMLRIASITDGVVHADGVGYSHYDLTPTLMMKPPR